MNKFRKAIKAIGLILRRPALLNLVLDSEEVKQAYVEKKYALKNGLPVIDLPFYTGDAKMKVAPFAFLDGGCIPPDLALLRALCDKYGVQDYLEIGTWRGESVANVADTGALCVSVNLPDQEMRDLGLDEDYVGLHRFFSEHLSHVNHIQANSHSFDFAKLDRKFDLIFIDGDHHTESIAKDTATAFSLLKSDNAMIVWHDYALGPETPRFEVLAGILDACPPEERKYLYHVSNTLSAIYTREKVPYHPLVKNANPEFYFSMQIETCRRET